MPSSSGALTGGGILVAAAQTANLAGGGMLSGSPFGANLSAGGMLSASVAVVPSTGQPHNFYMVRVVDSHGLLYAELENAVVTSVTWELNGFGGCVFAVPTLDPKLAVLADKTTQREIQVWRDPLDGTAPKLIFWGPVVRARANPVTVSFEAQGLCWYFSRLYLGPPLGNLLTNGDFEAGLAGWGNAGTVTDSIDPVIYYQGRQSLRMISSAEGLDNYKAQRFTLPAAPAAGGSAVYVAAAFQIVTYKGTPYIGPAYKERGLYVARISGGVVVDERWTPITNAAPRNQWVRIYAPVPTVAGAFQSDTYEVRLYSPGGDIRWDVVTARYDQINGSVAAGGVGTAPADIVTILDNVVASAHNPGEYKPADLNIGGPSGSLGVSLSMVFSYAAMANIWTDCMVRLVTEGLCDIDVVWDPAGTSRQVNCWVKKGSRRPQCTLLMGGNIGTFEIDTDGQITAGSVTVIGNSTKDPTLGTVAPQSLLFGFATDPTANGGVTLGAVINASYETTINGMQSKAGTELARLKNPVKTITVTTKENLAGSLIGVLSTGDIVRLIIDYGYVQENSEYRVAALTLTPADETLSVVLNLDLPGANALSPTQRAIDTANHTVVANVVRSLPAPAVSFRDTGAVAATGIAQGQALVYNRASGTLIPGDVGVPARSYGASPITACTYGGTGAALGLSGEVVETWTVNLAAPLVHDGFTAIATLYHATYSIKITSTQTGSVTTSPQVTVILSVGTFTSQVAHVLGSGPIGVTFLGDWSLILANPAAPSVQVVVRQPNGSPAFASNLTFSAQLLTLNISQVV